jgi:hypothetical protein
MLIHLLFLLASGHRETVKTNRVVDRCGIRVQVPRGLLAGTAKTKDKACSFALDPPRWASLRQRSRFQEPDHVITITVSNKPFDEVAGRAGFMTVAELRHREDDPTLCGDFSPETWLLPVALDPTAIKQSR